MKHSTYLGKFLAAATLIVTCAGCCTWLSPEELATVPPPDRDFRIHVNAQGAIELNDRQVSREELNRQLHAEPNRTVIISGDRTRNRSDLLELCREVRDAGVQNIKLQTPVGELDARPMQLNDPQ